MTTTQRHEALEVSIRQLGESMAATADRCFAPAERGDQWAADTAGAAYRRLQERREYLRERLESLELVLSN